MAGNSAQVTFAFLAKDLASATIRGLSKSFKNLKENARNLGGALKTGFKVGVAAIAAATAAVSAALVTAIKDASDFNETLSKTRVVFGEASTAVEDFAKTASSSIGLSESEALNAASTFAIFGKSANLAGTDLSKFSTDLTTLASDFGSFYNASNEDAITAIGAALRGESEPIKRFGILLNDTTLKNRAFSMGLIKTTKEALTPQNKVLAAQAEILAQAQKTGSLGDFSRTFGGSFPNQIKALRASFANLRKDIGGAFLPAVMRVFKALQPVIDSLFKEVRKRIPDLEKFANKIADDLVKNLPGYIATAKKEIPPLIEKFKGFFKEVVKFGKDAAKFLGKDGAVTGGLALIGAKIGGLKGALGGVLTKSFSDVGFGPFQSLLLGTVSSAVIAGMTEGLVGQATTKLIAAFALKMKLASTPAPVPGGQGIPPIAPIAAGGSILATLGTAIAAAVPIAIGAFAIDQSVKQAEMSNAITKLVESLNLKTRTTPIITPPKGTDAQSELVRKLFFTPTPKTNPMTDKYSSPTFNVYVGAETVANAVVPVIARTVTTTPRGGR